MTAPLTDEEVLDITQELHDELDRAQRRPFDTWDKRVTFGSALHHRLKFWAPLDRTANPEQVEEIAIVRTRIFVELLRLAPDRASALARRPVMVPASTFEHLPGRNRRYRGGTDVATGTPW